MEHSCGQSFSELQKHQNLVGGDVKFIVTENSLTDTKSFGQTEVELYTAYLGKVSVNVSSTLDNTMVLEHTLTFGEKKILVKVIDCNKNKLNYK